MDTLQEIFSRAPIHCTFREAQLRAEVKVAAAHACMLHACGMMDDATFSSTTETLAVLQKDTALAESAGDLREAVLEELARRIEGGERIRTAYARGDAEATVLRLCVRESADRVLFRLKSLSEHLLYCAKESVRYVMPKTLSPKHAVPVNCAQYFCSFGEMLLRDMRRFNECKMHADVLPLGSGELSGTSFPLDRELACTLLHFAYLTENAIDGVTDRDFAAEYLFCVSLTSEHLARLQEELLLASSPAYNFWDVPAERETAAAGRQHGRLAGALSTLSSLGADQIGRAERMLFEVVESCSSLLRGLVFHPVAMFDAAGRCHAAESAVSDYLEKKGASHVEAERIAAELVATCRKSGKALYELPFEEFYAESDLFERDILAAVTTRACVESRGSKGGSSTEAARKVLLSLRRKLRQY